MTTHRIGISCVGSGVGQSVITSCRLSGLPLHTVGLGTNPFAYGAYDCDRMDYTPDIYSPDYITELLGVLQKHGVHLLIPGLDDEALILARNQARLADEGIQAITAGPRLIELCRDKERMSTVLNPVVDVFVRSYDRKGAFAAIRQELIDYPLIAKPRGGSASQGIVVIRSEADLEAIGETHIIQELAIPHDADPNRESYLRQIEKGENPQIAEISIQLVTDPEGAILGRMASYNRLKNGIPIEVLLYEDERIWEVVDRLHPIFKDLGLRGPLNIQGRMTDQGLKLFEMNPRFTGITALRAMMGFNEVEACLKAWLGIPGGRTSLAINRNRFGIRQMVNRTVPLARNEAANQLSASVNPGPSTSASTILVTGAGGYLGRNLIAELLARTDWKIKALGRNKVTLKDRLGNPRVECFDLEDLRLGALSLGQIDCLVHCAFGRPHCTSMEIADSLAFTNELFMRAALHMVPGIVNISSQAVYGLSRPPPWDEEQPAAPETPYAQAKFASELLARNAQVMSNQTRTVSLRLSTLSGGRPGFQSIDLLGKLAGRALAGQPIVIVGGSQQMERLDVSDAVSAIMAILRMNPSSWREAYNVGPGVQHNIRDLAEKVACSVARLTGRPQVDVRHQDSDIRMHYGMDVARIERDAKWKAELTIDETIDSVVKHLMGSCPAHRGVGFPGRRMN